MKKIITLMTLFLTLGVCAEDELNIDISVSGQSLTIVKSYIGEPVSRRRRLVVTSNCSSKKVELYNDNFCDFSNFKIRDNSLSFIARFYNPDTGECTSPKSKSHKLNIKKCN